MVTGPEGGPAGADLHASGERIARAAAQAGHYS
jgi:hypothetical protein